MTKKTAGEVETASQDVPNAGTEADETELAGVSDSGTPQSATQGKTSLRRSRVQPVSESASMVPEGSAWDALENPEKYALPPQMRGYAARNSEVLRGNAPREQMNVRVRSELKRAAQILAAAQNLSLGDIIEEALIEYIKKNGGNIRD